MKNLYSSKIVSSIIGVSATVVAGLSLAGAPTAFVEAPAHEEAPPSDSGFYINGNVGYGHVDDQSGPEYRQIADERAKEIKGGWFDKIADAKTSQFSKSSRDGFVWSANLGYQVNRHFAVEGGYMDLPTTGAKFTTHVVPKPQYGKYQDPFDLKGRMRRHADFITLAAKGIWPAADRFSLFAKLGLAYSICNTFKADQPGNEDFDVSPLDVKGKSLGFYLVPLVGLGAAYHITNELAIELQGIATLKGGNPRHIEIEYEDSSPSGGSHTIDSHSKKTQFGRVDGVPATYSVLLGLSYKFTTL